MSEEDLVRQLIEAITAQTEAITALADSNYALVQAMVEAEGMGGHDDPGYLDAADDD